MMIVRAAGVTDVMRGVQFAREHDLELSVRSGGHNVTGCAVTNGGVMIDLSPMKGIRVDPRRRAVRAEAGVTWGELDHETQTFGLATTGGRISSTGIAGVTLGGGYGWLMRAFGLAIDNLLSADLVTADAELLTVSAAEHPDLFWGLRGGGGNFGIVTSFEYRLHALPPRVLGGAVFYLVDRLPAVLGIYRDMMASAPDELTMLLNVLVAPAAPFLPAHVHGKTVAALAVCHIGSPDAAARDLAPLRALGEPLVDRLKPMPYTTLQRLFDAAGVFGNQVHGRSGHLAELGDDVCETLVTHAPHITSPLSIVMLSPLGGAIRRVGEDETAFSHRHAAFDYSIESVWTDPHESARHLQWTDELGDALQRFSIGVYVNELGDEGEARVRDAYNPATFARLVELKHRYDPTNLFHLNQNIKLSGSTDVPAVDSRVLQHKEYVCDVRQISTIE